MKKLIAVSIMFMLVLGFAGCSQPAGGPDAAGSTAAAGNSADVADSNSLPDVIQNKDKTVTLTKVNDKL